MKIPLHSSKICLVGCLLMLIFSSDYRRLIHIQGC